MSDADGTRKESRSRRRAWLLGGVGVLVLVVAVAAVVSVVDPFGWNLLDKASGLRDEAAGAMPPGVGLYAEIDLINFSEETLTEFSQPFVAALAEPGVDDLGGGIERLDAMLAEEIGLTLSDDVRPWLGRSVGVGLTELAVLPDGRLDRAGWLLVAGTQDRGAADDFLDKLGRQLSERTGGEPTASDYRGRTITGFGPDEALPLGGLAFSRSGGQVIIGSDEATVRAAIDAQQGESLADSDVFQSLTGSLPAERGLTLYADQEQVPELGRLLAGAAPLAIGPLDLTSLALPPAAIGASIVDQGLRLDTAAPAAEAQSSPGQVGQGASLLPAEALAFVAGDSLDGAWGALKASLEAGDSLADFEESMALLSREFGYDPDRQLLPLLDGVWTLALLPADEGLLLELTGRPLGAVLLANGSDAAGISAAVDDLNVALEGQRLPLATADIGGVTATTIDLASLIGAPLPLYGVAGEQLFLGTDGHVLAQVLTGEASPGQGALDDDAAYQAAAAQLPEGYQVGAFADGSVLPALLSDGADGPTTRLMQPLLGIIAGTGPAVGGVRPGVVILVVE